MTGAGTQADGRIVVGVDGSTASRDALAWAAHQAKLTGARLEAVMTWHVPPTVYGAAMPIPPSSYDFSAETGHKLDEAIRATLGDDPGIDVTATVVEGHPAVELLDISTGADLLVVGSRGHGAFTGMLLGSVSEHCVSHASCPVVVVRHGRDAT